MRSITVSAVIVQGSTKRNVQASFLFTCLCKNISYDSLDLKQMNPPAEDCVGLLWKLYSLEFFNSFDCTNMTLLFFQQCFVPASQRFLPVAGRNNMYVQSKTVDLFSCVKT